MQIDDGILVSPLPENHKEQRGNGDDSERHDKVRLKPVVALALVEHNLQRTQTQGHETEADVVDRGLLQLTALHVGRVLNQARVSKIERMPTGILMKKIQRQVKLSVIHPPRVGPIAGAVTTAMP